MTKIEWTDRTWNPVTGCTKVSPGCAHCYAEGVAERFWKGRPFTDVQCHEDRLLAPLKWRKPERVFVNSMSDLFHEAVPDAFIARVWQVMGSAPQHVYQILTKRPERMRAWVRRWYSGEIGEPYVTRPVLGSVWLGVSVENQHFADERIPLLLQTPTAVRFISAEPLLGPVDLTRIDYTERCRATMRDFAKWQGASDQEIEAAVASVVGPSVIDALRGRWDDGEDSGDYERKLDWVIVGGESGPKARQMDLAWARSIVQQCKSAGVPVFVKQLGAKPYEGARPYMEMTIGQRGVHLADRKGGDMAEWPEDLRIRQWPA